jgi:hypothetical protein
VRKTIVTLAAALGLLVAATGASAAVLVEQETIYGGAASGNTIRLQGVRTTTAFAFGVWTSHLNTLPVTYSANIDCQNNANDRVVNGAVSASRTVSGAAYLWFGSPLVANPWRGWDRCAISVLITAPLSNDDSMIAWLVSHE